MAVAPALVESHHHARGLFGELRVFYLVIDAVLVFASSFLTPASVPDESLLVAVERAGIAAPSRCRSGECGWCRSRLVSGEVYIPEKTDGRRAADIDYNYIHPCSTFPLSDVVLEVYGSNLS